MLDQAVAFDTSESYAFAGRFVLVDDYDIAGGGIILEKLSEVLEPKNIFTSHGKVTDEERSALLKQRGTVLWLTGLSGSGKSTITIELERELMNRRNLAYRLDGDNIRGGLNSNLGYFIDDRIENIRRVSEVAKLFKDCSIIALVSSISPLRSMREYAKNIIGEDSFVEIYVKTPLTTCIERDPKGLYKKAMDGTIKNFTGISAPYEEPDCPDIILETEKCSVSDAVNTILDYLEEKRIID